MQASEIREITGQEQPPAPDYYHPVNSEQELLQIYWLADTSLFLIHIHTYIYIYAHTRFSKENMFLGLFFNSLFVRKVLIPYI